VRRLLLLAALAVLVAGCGSSGKSSAPPPAKLDGTALETTRAPDFALTDQDGKTVRLSALRGKAVLVTFLYTHCPDVCPLIATNLGLALRRLGPKAAGVRALAVSVDPKGDTAASVRGFVRSHRLPPQFRYLRGTKAELTKVWRAYHIAAQATPEDIVNHSAYTLLVDRNGDERALYDAQIKVGDVLHDLHALGLVP
jgi:protein SCO1